MERQQLPHEEEHRHESRSGGAEGGEHVHDHHDEQDHEKKSMMTKVKDKARKIKDTITKHGGHGHTSHETQPHHDDIHASHHHDHDHDMEDSDDEMEDDPEVHGAPIYESKEVRSNVPGQVATSIQPDVMVAGAHPTPVPSVAAGHPGTSSIHDVPSQRDAHRNTADAAMGAHGTSSIQGHDMTTTTAPTAVGHHETGSIQHDAMQGGTHETGPRHGTTSVPSMQAGAHGTTTAPLASGHHGTNISDSNVGLSREEHNLKDHRSFIPEQVGVSKQDNGVTFGGSQTHHDVGGTATQPMGHSLGFASAHDQTNLPVSSDMGMGGVFPQKTGILDSETALEPDPHALTGDRQPDNYQSKAKDPTGRGCEEIGITPILHSLDKMTTCDDDMKHTNKKTSTGQQEHGLMEPNVGLADKNRTQQLYSQTGSHDQFSPEPISHPPAQHESNVSPTTSVISDKAIQAKNVVASKLGYGGQHDGDHQKMTSPSHSYETEVEPEKTSSPPTSVTDYGKKAASMVYGKVDAPHEYEHKPGPEGVVSTKEYITEKVSPGEEDKALSEVISGAFYKDKEKEAEDLEDEKKAEPRGKKVSPGEEDKALSEVISGAFYKDKEKEAEDLEDEKKAEPRGKVTFSDKVVRQLGGEEEEEAHDQSVEDLGSGVSGPAGGGGMVDKLKDTFTSWLGIGGETDEPSSLVLHDIPKDANEVDQQDKGRGT